MPNVRFWMLLLMERYRQMIEVAIQQSGRRTGLEAADLALTKVGTTWSWYSGQKRYCRAWRKLSERRCWRAKNGCSRRWDWKGE
jgi:hypothetical protein